MKYFLIAGEASGDLHASHLISALRERDDEAEFRFYGGDLMEAAAQATSSASATAPSSEGCKPAATATAPNSEGCQPSATATAPSSQSSKPADTATVPRSSAARSPLLRHYKTLAYMGFVQVALHARTILRGLADCKRAIAEWRPDCIILVDYPGFNLKIAKWAKRNLPATPIYYYISPKIWAWKERRIKAIRRDVDRLFSILPFEVDFYEGKHHYPISYVGNPTYDEVAAYLAGRTNNSLPLQHEDIADVKTFGQQAEDRMGCIALLPGSRKQEIADNLHIMLRSVRHTYGQNYYRLLVCCAPGIDDDFYNAIFQAHNAKHPEPQLDIRPWRHTAFDLLRHANAALVTSGTATLEAAILDVPQVVCYNIRGGRIVNWAKKRFLKCRWISLVNLIADREVVPELIAADMNPQNLAAHLSAIIDGPAREDQLRGYDLVRQRLATPGAPQRAAEEMVALLKARQ